MVARNRLLPMLRTRDYEWCLRAAKVGGALMGLAAALSPVLVATHPKPPHHSALWTAALVVVIVLGSLGIAAAVFGGALAFLLRPVQEGHAQTLLATAGLLAEHLESGAFVLYDDDRHEQAFRTHFKTLAQQLDAWNDRRTEGGEAQRVLSDHIDVAMEEHGIEAPTYNMSRIKGYVWDLALRHTRGEVSWPSLPLKWQGYSSAKAPDPDVPAVPGPPYGSLNPIGNPEWISLPPTDGEMLDDWRVRADEATRSVEDFLAAAEERLAPDAEAAIASERIVRDFEANGRRALSDALQNLQEREPPRIRHRCQSC